MRKAAEESALIDPGTMDFAEFESLAQSANEMVMKRNEAVKALRESEERFRLAFQTIPDSISINRYEDGVYVYVNDSFTKISGFTREEVLGKSIFDLDVYCNDDDRRKLLSELKTKDQVLNMEAKLRKKDGSVHTGLLSAGFITLNGVRHLIAIVKDIEDYQKAKQALRESEEKYRLLVENANDAIYIAQDGILKFPNPKVHDLLGYTRDQLINEPFVNYIHPEDREMVRNRHVSRLKGEDLPSTYAFRILNRQGNIIWVQLNTVLISWEGRPATLNIVRDITQQVKLEQQMRQASKMEAVGILASGIAHDFNNILQVISGYIQVLSGKRGPDQAENKYFQGMENALNRGAELVKRLLIFGRRAETKVQTMDLNQEVRTAVQILERTIPRIIKIETSLQDGLNPINGDPTQIQQVLLNLGANARDAMPDGGRLIIETENIDLDEHYSKTKVELMPGSYVLLKVTDTGQGMDKETQEHIFDPFFTTKEVGQGTGLGLSIVYGIVKNHDGHINCYSEKGQGTIFKLYFPLALEAKRDASTETAFEQKALQGSETILLVDDEEEILEVGEQLLKQYGYSVLKAPNGNEALNLYKTDGVAIDLVILDLNMPGLSGQQCLREILAYNARAKVIIASGYSPNGQHGQALADGALAYISKPYHVVEILRKVRAVLDG
ncbi:MAG: PAS domain S-box protein [Thermodesulfobacteriota bacterium]